MRYTESIFRAQTPTGEEKRAADHAFAVIISVMRDADAELRAELIRYYHAIGLAYNLSNLLASRFLRTSPAGNTCPFIAM